MLVDPVAAVRLVATQLGDLVDQVVFLGGAITGLLIDDVGGPPPRPTKDVDVVVEVTSYFEYAVTLRTKLLARGLAELAEAGAPQWVVKGVEGVRVDVMPTQESVLGLKNRWYSAAYRNAAPHAFPNGPVIRLITAPYFLGTKLEAFRDRGDGDYYHRDLEDVVAVIDGRSQLIEELENSQDDLRAFVAQEIAGYLSDFRFRDALPGHLPSNPAGQARLDLLLDRLTRIASFPAVQ